MTKCFNLLQRESDVRQIWTASILLSTAVSSSAVTLGRYSGVALIGRPLDVQVQVLLAPGEDLANQCLAADVYYGDFQLAPNLVTATPRGGASETDGTVRIQSSQPVNEPIVTLYVRAGCGTPFTRRFVLLADLINEPAVAGSPVVVPMAESWRLATGATYALDKDTDINLSWAMVWLGDMPVDQSKSLSGDRISGQFDSAWIQAVTGNMTWRF